ncbi:MAG TPA: replication-associated recombination protein A [Bacteroidales bacterium]|jgi:putative ATPase|nr:replication-associated recombination protein A [Bacteroidales bacterium]HOU97824.1 replication-associated recombination protein A [Bacteroidales bacterium]
MEPLAERLRPKTFDDFIGQEHLVGPKGVIRKMVDNNSLHSIILWGPPGVGKTTMALMLSQMLNRNFFHLSATQSSVKDVREVIEKIQKNPLFNQQTPIVFLDEIHRFSKAQQDSLLHAVEKGLFILIGATTENPSFEVITPLLSRCQVYILKPLSENDLIKLVQRALKMDVVLKKKKVEVKEYEALIRFSGGDARKLLNILELLFASEEADELIITNDYVQNVLQEKIAVYDKNGEMHYDVISAFIKSVRGSDPNAAVYYLARMLEGGEDVKFIARRMVILAAEDIGLANPNALLLAQSAFDAVHQIGMPEARIVLAEVAIYLASSPKSNSAYMAIEKALDEVRKSGDLSVPLHIRNAPTKFMKNIGYGKDYQYAHSFEGHFVNQEFLPEKITGTSFYEPAANPRENEMKNYLSKCWKGKYGY